MIMGHVSARAILFTATAGLFAAVVAGGALMAIAEGRGYLAGAWLIFNVVTTLGFGAGPASGIGQALAVVTFCVAVTCWFAILLVAIEVGYARFQRHALIEDALRPLVRRPRDRLFTEN
ncbi:MAG: hypothetical protein ACRDKT_18290 [Actinomycetota bacterium]